MQFFYQNFIIYIKILILKLIIELKSNIKIDTYSIFLSFGCQLNFCLCAHENALMFFIKCKTNLT